jgi:hypothetical protein
MVNPTNALITYSRKKINKHRPHAEAQGKRFLPLAFYSYGVANEEVNSLISQLAVIYAEKTNSHFSVALSYISTTLNITLLRGSARMILERFQYLSREVSIPSDLPSSRPEALDIHDDTSSIDDHERSLLFPTQASTVDSEFYLLPDLPPSG